MNKKTLFLILITASLALFFIVIAVYFYLSKNVQTLVTPPAPAVSPSKMPSPTRPPLQRIFGKININGVLVKDFYATSQRITDKNDAILVENSDYIISYVYEFDEFLITILASPFPELQKQAQAKLISLLDIGEQEACRLKASLTTPYFANREYSGKSYPLSFCH